MSNASAGSSVYSQGGLLGPSQHQRGRAFSDLRNPTVIPEESSLEPHRTPGLHTKSSFPSLAAQIASTAIPYSPYSHTPTTPSFPINTNTNQPPPSPSPYHTVYPQYAPTSPSGPRSRYSLEKARQGLCYPQTHPLYTRRLDSNCYHCQLRRQMRLEAIEDELDSRAPRFDEDRWRVTYRSKDEEEKRWIGLMGKKLNSGKEQGNMGVAGKRGSVMSNATNASSGGPVDKEGKPREPILKRNSGTSNAPSIREPTSPTRSITGSATGGGGGGGSGGGGWGGWLANIKERAGASGGSRTASIGTAASSRPRTPSPDSRGISRTQSPEAIMTNIDSRTASRVHSPEPMLISSNPGPGPTIAYNPNSTTQIYNPNPAYTSPPPLHQRKSSRSRFIENLSGNDNDIPPPPPPKDLDLDLNLNTFPIPIRNLDIESHHTPLRRTSHVKSISISTDESARSSHSRADSQQSLCNTDITDEGEEYDGMGVLKVGFVAEDAQGGMWSPLPGNEK